MKYKRILIFLILLSVLGHGKIWAQEDSKFLYEIKSPSKKDRSFVKRINRDGSDSLKKLYVNDFVQQKRMEGYLELKAETTSTFNKIYLNLNEKYVIGNIKYEKGLPEFNTELIRYSRRLINKPCNQFNIDKIIYNCLKKYQNNGYPFTLVRIDSSIINKKEIVVTLNISNNNLILFDSILLKGDARINQNYLNNYTGIKQGGLYNEDLIIALPNRLNEISFIKSIRKPDVVFIKDKAKIIYYLGNKVANQFDGFAGILPDEKTGRINITGNAQIRLVNSFGQGEQMELNWRKMQPLTQDLKLMFSFPFIAGSPFGFENTFKLYKRDTTFIDLTNSASANYFINQWNSIKVIFGSRRTSLLNPQYFKNSNVLPEFADINNTMYGLGFRSEKLDYRLNPRKGFRLNCSTSAGTKRINKNPILNEKIYENVILNSVQYSGQLAFDLFIPLFKKSTLNIGSESGGILGKNLFRNELYRIGGLVSLRGFDEESINASSFVINTIEYRFLYERNSSLYVFSDFGWYENSSLEKYINDYPLGFGAGISFQTKAGIFSINYALGRQFNNPVSLRSAKIHFGLVNFF